MMYNLYSFLHFYYLVIYCVISSCWKYIIYSTFYKVRGHNWYLRSSLYLKLGYVSLQNIKPELWWNELYPYTLLAYIFFKSVFNITTGIFIYIIYTNIRNASNNLRISHTCYLFKIFNIETLSVISRTINNDFALICGLVQQFYLLFFNLFNQNNF